MTIHDDTTRETLRLAHAIAARAGIYVAGERFSDLAEAGIDLAGAGIEDLRGACIDLAGATLAELVAARIDLDGAGIAELRAAGIDLSGATLTEVHAAGVERPRRYTHPHTAHAAGIDLRGPDTPSIPDIHRVVRDAVGAEGERLDMRKWHSDCGTVHCIAGWVVTLAGAAGEAEVERQDKRTAWAAAAIYQASDPQLAWLPPMRCHCPRVLALAALEALAAGP